VSHWYPYPLIDVAAHGYAVAVRNSVGLIVLVVGVGTRFLCGDPRLRPA
jgi:hypothetical protein